MSKKNSLPSVFAMTASFSVSNGLMFGVKEDGSEIPVEIIEKTIKGTLSNEADGKKAEKQDNIANANIQTVDSANLPNGTKTLRLKFGIKVVPNLLTPSACNKIEYRESFYNFVSSYINNGGIKDLAERYTQQIFSGDYLWRNKYALDIDIRIEAKTRDGSITARNKNGAIENFNELSSLIEETLVGNNQVLFINVVADAELDSLAEVYPSQDFVDSKKSKVLFYINNEDNLKQAAMHSQKIGNALRRIDDWYGEDIRAIAVEPYGVDQEKSVAYRKESDKNSLYTYIRKLDTLTQEINEFGIQDHHKFVIACFIRGGVFGGKD